MLVDNGIQFMNGQPNEKQKEYDCPDGSNGNIKLESCDYVFLL